MILQGLEWLLNSCRAVKDARTMKTMFTIGAISQSVAEAHKIALFGNPCPIKYGVNIAIKSQVGSTLDQWYPIKYEANIAIKSTFNTMAATVRVLIALFLGFAPYKNPKIAVSVVIEHGGSGASIAAPIAKKIFKKALS